MTANKFLSESIGVYQIDDEIVLGLSYKLETQEATITQDFECKLTLELWEKLKKCASHFFKVAAEDIIVSMTIWGGDFELRVRNELGSNELFLDLLKDGKYGKTFPKQFSVEEWFSFVGLVGMAFQEIR